MTKVEILIYANIAWTIIALLVFVGLNRILKPEYRKFYPHPSVGIILDNKYDYQLNRNEKVLLNVASAIIFIPITPVWIVAWCLYKLSSTVYKSFSHRDEIITEPNNNDENKVVDTELSTNIDSIEETSKEDITKYIQSDDIEKEEVTEDVEKQDSIMAE